MDINRFYGIGIVEVYWTYDELKDNEWKKAFISIYFPNNIGYNRGEQFAVKYYFMDNDVVFYEEIIETSKYNLEILKKNDNFVELKLFDTMYKFTLEQFELLKKIIDNQNNLSF